MKLFDPRRRQLLSGIGATGLALLAGRVSFAQTTGSKKFVLVILRGAMDGLAAVAAYGDPAYARARGRLALAAPGESDGLLPIADGFGLHPRLGFLHETWQAGQLAILHATCSPYRSRSHFDGQDVLENGGANVFGLSDGWLNRALTLLPSTGSASAVAIGGSIPIVLRGSAPVSSWAPSTASAVPGDTIARLTDLYAGDPLLSPTLAQAIDTASIVGDGAMRGKTGGRDLAGGHQVLAAAAARILAAPDGPASAVLSFEGWDTHANQGAANGALALRLQGLDRALRTLKTDLGQFWDDTVIVVATEFGRTVAENGTGGTDHGTGGAAFALGGAVRGRRMLGDWPGLAPAALFEGRDLAPVNDVRSLFACVLRDHWGLDAGDLRRRIFPDGQAFRPLDDVVI
jgi:uncharacterized protein (DUF1501 family)